MESRRDKVIRLLQVPHCARQLSEKTGIREKTVQTILARLGDGGLVRCITPEQRQSRLYALTPHGRLMRIELDPSTKHEPMYDHEPPWELYSWIQAGRYRRLILRHLVPGIRPSQLRKRDKAEFKTVGVNNICCTLQDFRARGLATEHGGRWKLTELGRTFQRLAYPDDELNQTAKGPADWQRCDGAAGRPAPR